MKQERIQQLLDRYFDGETTLEEEATLRQYFTEEQVAPELEPFQQLFQFFRSEQEAGLSADFDSQLLKKLEVETPVAKIRRLPNMLLRVAAVAALLVAAYFILPEINGGDQQLVMDEQYWDQFEPQSEEEAYEQAKEALLLLSSKLNGGAKTAATEINKVESVSKIFK